MPLSHVMRHRHLAAARKDALLAFTLLILGTTVARADSIPVLGAAADFAALASVGAETFTNSNVTINGNQGAVEGSTIVNQGPSTINGNVLENTPSQFSNTGTLNGSVIADPALMGANGTVQTALNNLTNQFNNYTMYMPIPNIMSTTTLNATGPLTEYTTGAIDLINGHLTINGSPDQVVVIKVTGNITLLGTSSLALSGGITPSNVFYYLPSFSQLNTSLGDTMNGIIYGPDTIMTVRGTWNGELISDQNGSFESGAILNQFSPPIPPIPPPIPPPSEIPIPAAFPLFATGLGALGLLGWRRKRKVQAAA